MSLRGVRASTLSEGVHALIDLLGAGCQSKDLPGRGVMVLLVIRRWFRMFWHAQPRETTRLPITLNGVPK